MISIDVNGITKRYGTNAALDDLNLSISKPGIYGIVGSNGSGKTTLLKIITGLSLPTSGTVSRSDGERRISIEEFLMHTGVLIGTPKFRKGIRGMDLIRATASVKGLTLSDKSIDYALTITDSKSFAELDIAGYSRGMVQRLLLSNSIIGNPKVLVFDEPTSGLDPDSRNTMHSIIRDLDNGERIIIFTSHDLWEVESLCQSAVVLEAGRIKGDWIDTTVKDHVYITMKPGGDISDKHGLRKLKQYGMDVLVSDGGDDSTIVKHFSDDVDSIQRGSALPLVYLGE